MKPWRIATIGTALAAAAAIIVVAGRHDQSAAVHSASPPPAALRITLPAEPGTYLGAYAPGVPGSYTNVTAFTNDTGVRPNVVVYYSGWGEPFQASFAKEVAKHGAVPVVQIQPTGIDLTAIATGRYDHYLASYARAVLAYGHPVIMSFGHEMNGTWYSWSNGNSSPKAFVAAWRRIVMDFRTVGAENVTWLWTVNVIDPQAGIPDPRAWWPGSSYVTWVGIDGYYTSPKVRFVSLFGPTIVAIRTLTNDPILIAETGAAGAHQPASITDLFAGIRSYQILGLIWFDADTRKDWQLTSAPAIAAFRLGAAAYPRAGS